MKRFTLAYFCALFVYNIISAILCYFFLIKGASDNPLIARLGLWALVIICCYITVTYSIFFIIIAWPLFMLVKKIAKRFPDFSFSFIIALIMGGLIACAQNFIFQFGLHQSVPYQMLVFLILCVPFGFIFAPVYYWFKSLERVSHVNIQKTFE